MQRKSFLLCLLGLLLLAPSGWGVEAHYSAAKLTSVERKIRERVDMYIVNTPVSTEVPYFEIMVRQNQTEYTAQYTPRHEDEELPVEWVAGADVQIRLEKHALSLKRTDGTEIRWSIVKKKVVKDSAGQEPQK